MSELNGQLFSTKVQNLADGAAGHNNESTQNEITWDNPIDVGATNITLITCNENLCWAILDDGPGMPNIQNLTGTGKGMKIKTSDKIGNKIQGEFASAIYYEPTELMYFSRTNDISSEFNPRNRRHQQLNLQPHAILGLVREEGADLSEVDKIIYTGLNQTNHKKYYHLPEPSRDKFDASDVEDIKLMFKNNEKINKYFDSDNTGVLKVYIYDKNNQAKYNKLIDEMPKIINKNEFITYNTVKGCLQNISFSYINIDSGITRVVNSDSCHKNFVLGRNSLYNDDEEEDEEEDDEEEDFIETSTFGKLYKNKVLSITCNIYDNGAKQTASCKLNNFSNLQEFILFNEECIHASKITPEKYNKLKTEELTEDKKLGEVEIYISFISENESAAQFNIMNKLDSNLTNDQLKGNWVYCNGRFLNYDKIPCEKGIFERNLPELRFVSCFNLNSKSLIGLQSQKSAINLKLSKPIYLLINEKIIKPIINEYASGSKDETIISLNSQIRRLGVSNWDNEKNRILKTFNLLPKPAPTLSPPPVSLLSSTTPSTVSTTSSSSSTSIQPSISTPVVVSGVVPISPPTSRGPAPVVLSQLNKPQAISQLNRIKNLLKTPKYKSRSERSKLYTMINNINKEIILDDDEMGSFIDHVIESITLSEKPNNVKNAAALQDIM